MKVEVLDISFVMLWLITQKYNKDTQSALRLKKKNPYVIPRGGGGGGGGGTWSLIRWEY